MTVLVIANVALLVIVALVLLGELELRREVKQHAARIQRAADELEGLRADLQTKVTAKLDAFQAEVQQAVARVRAEAGRARTALPR